MKKKAIIIAVIFTLVSAITLSNVALAAHSDKPANSPPGKAKAGKATDPTEQVDDVEENIKCTILHKEKEITVSINALPAHILNHEDSLADEEDDPDCIAEETALTGEQPTTGDQPPANQSGDTVQGEETQKQTTDTLQQKKDQPEKKAGAEDTATVKTCDGKSTKLKKEEKLTLDLHNKTRQENELRELCVDATLTNVAREHSEDMIEKGYFGHNSSDSKSSAKRLKDSGYNWSAMAENIAWGSGSYSKPASRFKAWMESEGHEENILNEKYEEVGIGIATGELKKGGQEETVYTVEFGSKKK